MLLVELGVGHVLARADQRAIDVDALVGVLDHVGDVAEIDDVGRRALFVGEERRVPAGHRDTHPVQPQQIVATTAVVVKERSFLVDEAVVECKCHRAGERGPPDGCAIGSRGAHREALKPMHSTDA